MNGPADRPGVRHLVAIAQHARPAGSTTEADARAYAARILTEAGFDVREERFRYSAFPGRYATPVCGAALAVTMATAGALLLRGADIRAAAAVILPGVALVTLFAWLMLGDGVLIIPWMRAEGVNLVATRGTASPKVWLVAHIDSKSQPVPSLIRAAGFASFVSGLALLASGFLLTRFEANARTVIMAGIAMELIGTVPMMLSVIGSRSNGAVDNASGVAAVLAAAGRLSPTAACGVVLPSAEELGLAGARAWARSHARAIALNCDGVDDEGELVILYNHGFPTALVSAMRDASGDTPRVRRMPLGLMTDSTALTSVGWSAVTVSHGSYRTLRRVHTPQDSLARLRGTAIDDVAGILSRAAEALAS